MHYHFSYRGHELAQRSIGNVKRIFKRIPRMYIRDELAIYSPVGLSVITSLSYARDRNSIISSVKSSRLRHNGCKIISPENINYSSHIDLASRTEHAYISR